MAAKLPKLIHELSDVDVAAVSIVGKGANRKRFFLRRSGDEPATELLRTSPAPHKLIVKGADGEWSAVYCVVAEPGWLEDAGLYGDQEIADRWASEDEIRKAAHRFAKNGSLVTKLHESLEPYGALVENVVAPIEFTVDGPDGVAHTIRKGSWYVAIEPNADGRTAIEAGEFNGVSIEGTGVRTLVEKRAPTRDRGNVGRVKGNGSDGLVRRALAKLLGDDPLAAELEAELAKERPTFAERMAARDFDEELPGAFDELRSAIWSAFYPYDEDDAAPAADLVRKSLDEFGTWCEALLEAQPVAKIAAQIEKANGQTGSGGTVEDVLTDEQAAALAKVGELATKIDELPAAIAKAIKDEAEAPEPAEGEDAPATLEDVAKAVKDLGAKVDAQDTKITALGEGGTSQNGDGGGEPVGKSSGKPHDGIL